MLKSTESAKAGAAGRGTSLERGQAQTGLPQERRLTKTRLVKAERSNTPSAGNAHGVPERLDSSPVRHQQSRHRTG
jgi:hypothetical protein